MKKSVLAIVCALATVGAYAQGTVNFANIGGGGLNAPVFNVDGTRLAGTDYLAQLYVEGGGAFTAVGSPVPFQSGASAGYFLGGTVSVPTVAPGATGTFQVRAWNAAGGATYAAASVNPNAFVGESVILSVDTGNPGAAPPTLPGALTGLQSFALVPVPEPTTIALGLIGAAALLLRRRNK